MEKSFSLFSLAFVTLMIILQAGCIRYVEEPTPPGSIPPPIQDDRRAIPEGDPSRVGRADTHSKQMSGQSNREEEDAFEGYGIWDTTDQEKMEIPLSIAPSRRPMMHAGQVEQDFSRVYEQVGRPKFLLFMNRNFSAEVSSWVTGRRLSMDFRSDQAAPNLTKEQKSLDISGQYQERDHGRRDSPVSEAVIATIEEGFMAPFFNIGCELVDRSVVLRIVAEGKLDVDRGLANIQSLETRALKKYADILVEIVLLEDSGAPHGIEIRAVAKNIHDGRILAISSAVRAHEIVKLQNPRIATSRGYQETVPSFKESAYAVAILLMYDLYKKNEW
jgi:hypothetical protein